MGTTPGSASAGPGLLIEKGDGCWIVKRKHYVETTWTFPGAILLALWLWAVL
jgi:hypothetical protein